MAEKVTNAMAFEDKNENKKNGNNGEERGPHLTHNFELKEMETCDYLEEEEANNSLSGPIKNNSVERQGGEHKLLGLKVNRPDPIWKVYSRNRWCKKELRPNETVGPKD